MAQNMENYGGPQKEQPNLTEDQGGQKSRCFG